MTTKTCSLILFLMLSLQAFAQDFSVSATAGYVHLNSVFKVDDEDYDLDFKNSGFFVGAQSEIDLTETIALQPELLIAISGDYKTLYFGTLGAFEVAENFSLLAGPAINYLLEEVATNYSKLGVFGVFGAKYNITKNISAQAKYGIQLNNFYTGSSDISSKVNYLLIGASYKFL